MIDNASSTKLKQQIKAAMRKATPKDTGNLAYNALRVYRTKDGFHTRYLGRVAGYGKILNQTIYRGVTKRGSMKRNKHFGWHPRSVHNGMLAVGRYFDKNMKGRMNNNYQDSKYKPYDGETREASFKQMQKWEINSARQKFELNNKNRV